MRLAIAKRTARKSRVGTRSSRSWIRKNVEPQHAVTASSAAVASSVVRRVVGAGDHPHHASRSDDLEGDDAPLGDLVPAAGARAGDVAQAEVDPRLLDVDLEAEALEQLRWPPRHPSSGGLPGTSTSSGPFETTSFTVSPWWRTPVAGSWEMTRPSATWSEYSARRLDLEVVAGERVLRRGRRSCRSSR